MCRRRCTRNLARLVPVVSAETFISSSRALNSEAEDSDSRSGAEVISSS